MIWRYNRPERFSDFEKPDFSKDNKIVLYGAGRMGGMAAHCLKKRGVNVSVFCDRAEDKQGTFFCGIKVISPDELIRDYKNATVIISSSFHASIRDKLSESWPSKLYDCADLFLEINFDGYDFWMEPDYAIRMVEQYLSSLYTENIDKGAIDAVYLTVTTKCTLRCSECSSFVPYVAKHKDYSAKDLMRWLYNTLNVLEAVRVINFYGGEPFLHPQLAGMLDMMANEQRVEQIQVTTNATILPSQNLLDALKNTNAHIRVSQYAGNTRQKVNQIAELFDRNDIQYEVVNFTYWDAGARIENFNASPPELRRRFLECVSARTLYIIGGKGFICSPSCFYHAVDENCRYNKEYATVDGSAEAVRQSISELQNRFINGDYIEFCKCRTGAHCTHSARKVPVAEQASELLRFPNLD